VSVERSHTDNTGRPSGKVEAYEAGKTLTITRSDGSNVTYIINAKSRGR
jgi:hypothetical protein